MVSRDDKKANIRQKNTKKEKSKLDKKIASKIVLMLILLLIGVILALYLSRTNDHSSTYGIVISVDNRIRNAIQYSLIQYKQDLANEEVTCFQWNVTVDGLNASWLRDNLTEFWKIHNTKGCVLIGDFPYARWESSPGMHSDHQYPTDYFYMDLDGHWNDTDGNGAYDEHVGDIAPEIWVGRIKASNVDGVESELINNYFKKNHDYRASASSSAWPRRALAYIDNGIITAGPMYGDFEIYLEYVENTTICLKKTYGQNVVMIYDTNLDANKTNVQDYKNRLTSTVGYEWVWLYSHGYQWPAPSYGYHTFNYQNVYWDFYLKNSPKAVFYIWDVCEAAEFNSPNCLGSSAIFGNGWGLVSIGMTAAGTPQSQFFEFFDYLEHGRCIGEAFKTVWNCTIFSDEYKKWVILGDPTLHVSTAD